MERVKEICSQNCTLLLWHMTKRVLCNSVQCSGGYRSWISSAWVKLSLKLIQRLITSLYHNVHAQESPSPVISTTECYTEAIDVEWNI